MMFPYPSAEGLHVGNMFAFTGSDVYGRFKRLQGYDVFEPIGYDAFGIHSENYAIKMGINPAILIPKNIENFRRQLKRIGGMFDWRHELSTTDPAYYKWTQWIFLQLLKAGKAYKKTAAVNWCPHDKTVLANEQVINGHCERCGAAVEQRMLEQWFFRITEYADRLLADLDDESKMDWSDSTTTAQRNWLGRSEGAELDFPLAVAVRQSDGDADEPVDPGLHHPPRHGLRRDVHGAGAGASAGGRAHDRATQRKEVEAYRKQAAAKDLVSRKVGEKEKTGVFTGGYAVNPATGQPIPVWVADYVLMEYGTGAIMAVPGHDERDFEFAKKFELPIVRVVAEPERTSGRTRRWRPPTPRTSRAGWSTRASSTACPSPRPSAPSPPGSRSAGQGRPSSATASTTGASPASATGARRSRSSTATSTARCRCRRRTSRSSCPLIEDFTPDDTGISPLARHEAWYHAPCPVCGKRGRRETDVSDTFLDSAWYFLRYPSSEFDDGRSTRRGRRSGSRSRPTSAATSTRCCTCSTRASSPWCCTTWGPALRRAVPEVPGPRADREGRGQDVEVAGQRGGAGRVHRPLGRGHLPDVPHVPGPVPGGRRLPRRGDQRAAAVPGEGVGAGGATPAAAHADDEVRHDVLVKYHQTEKRVTEGMEELRYNTASRR